MMIWGLVPAAGQGTRIQPLAFSKELLPVGSRHDGERERPRAVSDYLVERMVRAGASRLCFVISPSKSDIVEYYGGRWSGPPGAADVVYAVQEQPRGLCDALFRARPLIRDEDEVLVGLPDTIWFPDDGLARLGGGDLSFLLFPVDRPERFDAVVTDEPDLEGRARVREVQVKRPDASTGWVWGAFRLRGAVLHALHDLWVRRDPRDEYLGTLVNAWIAEGGVAHGVRAGTTYVDVGTLDGYREAQRLLAA
jgi:glucose-1-phosphate thymidylyltransferase